MQISYRLQQAHLDAERKRNIEEELEGARERQEDLKRRVVSFRFRRLPPHTKVVIFAEYLDKFVSPLVSRGPL